LGQTPIPSKFRDQSRPGVFTVAGDGLSRGFLSFARARRDNRVLQLSGVTLPYFTKRAPEKGGT
jgi:hypothetical protein